VSTYLMTSVQVGIVTTSSCHTRLCLAEHKVCVRTSFLEGRPAKLQHKSTVTLVQFRIDVPKMHVFTNPQTSQLTRRSCIDLLPLEAFHPVPRSATSCAPMHDQLVEGSRLCYTPQLYVRPTGSGIRPADSVPWLHRRFCTI
jgi:hypothetical protein